MPTYEYRCEACGHEFERFQSITAPAVRKCPECSKLKVRRLIGSGAGIIFKGSGFYETDYRSENYKKAAEKDRESSKPKKEESSSSSDSGSSGSSAKKPKKGSGGNGDSKGSKKTA